MSYEVWLSTTFDYHAIAKRIEKEVAMPPLLKPIWPIILNLLAFGFFRIYKKLHNEMLSPLRELSFTRFYPLQLAGIEYFLSRNGLSEWTQCCAGVFRFFLILSVTRFLVGCGGEGKSIPAEKKLNVIFILSDDHRYDFMGFTGKVPELKTPALDRMGREGVHLKNAFVSTALCSPSRASILTGQYTHHHNVIDNQSPVPDSARFFPEYLQQAGYQTAFLGKWHMGNDDSKPRKGFDHWVSFKGQGVYYNPTLNVNGQEISYKDSTHITDLLTAKTLEFLNARNKEKPFFIYLSHKAVHAEFKPAKRHVGVYKNIRVAYPPSMFPPDDKRSSGAPYNYADLPDWVKKQRYSFHGVDFMYHGAIQFEKFYQNYCETLLGVDESVQAILDQLEKDGLMDNTVVFYMGDNGFSFGEHGLIDKRHAYEESIRVPLLAMGKNIAPGSSITEMVQNIDIGPTILELTGVTKPKNMDGESFATLLAGEKKAWRDTVYYEYFWERPFPQTPTVFAVRTTQYKFIRYQGLWDINELYDIQSDPDEMNNLIRSPQHQEIAKKLDQSLFRWLQQTNGMSMPLRKDEGTRFDHKYKGTY